MQKKILSVVSSQQNTFVLKKTAKVKIQAKIVHKQAGGDQERIQS